MIKDVRHYRDFEDNYLARSRVSLPQAFAIVEGLWAEGVALGVLPPKDPMEGIETDIRIAAILNSCSRS